MAYDPKRALELLRIGSGRADAIFRDGQEDAIRHIVDGKGRLLVVQKTGWGKSFVYFIAIKLLREAGGGPALLISPLLALMRNQIAAAERMGGSRCHHQLRQRGRLDGCRGQTGQGRDRCSLNLAGALGERALPGAGSCRNRCTSFDAGHR